MDIIEIDEERINTYIMKKVTKILIMLFAVIVCSGELQKPLLAQQGYVSFQVFYDQLSPYGEWIDYPAYGFVWIPDAGPDFSPYCTNGYWVMTQFGWTWVSGYRWGWAPFHYGRWDFNNDLGWFWVPDNVWGPSWVTWRRADGYYGWTPMRPGISINLSFGNSYRDIDRWYFVRDRDFGRQDMYRYYVNRRDNNVIIRNSVVINATYNDNRRNAVYVAGPPREEVQRYTGRTFRSVTVQDDDRPGQRLINNRLQIYRPQVQQIGEDNHRSAPAKVYNPQDVRPRVERNNGNQPDKSTVIQNNRRSEQQGELRQRRQRGTDQQQPRLQDAQQQQGQVLQKNEQQKQDVTKPSVNTRRGKRNTNVTPPEKTKKDNQINNRKD